MAKINAPVHPASCPLVFPRKTSCAMESGGYHLVMTLPVCHGKSTHFLLLGKPSISMGHGLTMAMLNNQRVYFLIDSTVIVDFHLEHVLNISNINLQRPAPIFSRLQQALEDLWIRWQRSITHPDLSTDWGFCESHRAFGFSVRKQGKSSGFPKPNGILPANIESI